MPYVTTNSIRMYYEEAGDGVPLLFISGTGWSGEHWKLEQVPYFSSSYRTIVFDHRGCGRSDRPTGPYTTRQFAEDAVGLLAAVGIDEPAHILGHSMGGRVAQWMAVDHPEVVRSLVLAATGPGVIDDRPRVVGITPEFVVQLLEHGWPGYHEEHLRGTNMFVQADPETVERFAATHRGRFGTDVVSYLRHFDARQRHDTVQYLAKIDKPALVICGTEDNYQSPGHVDTSKYLAEHLPNVELVFVDHAAHALHIETAGEFNAAVGAFLART